MGLLVEELLAEELFTLLMFWEYLGFFFTIKIHTFHS
jgi:hypothetical protein